jgi:hypothetical protein
MKHFLIGLTIFISGFSSAQAQSLISELQACRAETNSTARLACYDNLPLTSAPQQAVKKAQDQLASSKSAPAVTHKAKQAPQPEASRQNQVKNFGLDKVIEPKDKVEKITSVISAIQKTPYGKLIVTLESGQVWRQTNNTTLRLKPGQEVYVEEGALGSYFLGKESSNKRIRVKRSH